MESDYKKRESGLKPHCTLTTATCLGLPGWREEPGLLSG